MTANTAKANDLSISLEGGPTRPPSWRKWEKEGARYVVEYLNTALIDLGYTSGEVRLIGVQGLKGGKNSIRFTQVLAERNAIELIAQLGSKESRWKYHLHLPSSFDLVTLFEQLQEHNPELVTDDTDDDSDSAEVINLGVAKSTEGDPAYGPEMSTATDLGNEADDSTDATQASEFDQASSIHPDLQELVKLSAEYVAASRSAQDNAPEIEKLKREIEKLKREIKEREEMLRMYMEEQDEAEAILASEKHRTAEEKLQKIRAILES